MSEAVITWLESPAGQRWSAGRHIRACRHNGGIFADIKEDGVGSFPGPDAYRPRWRGRVFFSPHCHAGAIRVIPGFPRNLPSPG